MSSNNDADNQNSELNEVARDERESLKQQLRQEVGREPTTEELDDWLRQHTEGY
ncbi:MAG TPA: hypothetical protein VJT50_02850 [Pyrinomonadaceae bacterium]|nr:hypothetical protein [Pyrinomonadaceae bacterium]